MLAYEAFIRRASEVNLPFMLKGSYVTRQYFPNPHDRLPNDLDWVYLPFLTDIDDARSKFNDWVIQVTDAYQTDGTRFLSFKQNAFWRMIDYAMADDFPTVNTDLTCWVDNEKFDWFSLDISFNLDIEVGSVPLLYQPVRGEPFTIPQTVPLSLQVAWKIHQTLVRPRFKDIFDLIHLLQHPAFDAKALAQAQLTLVNECSADNVDVRSLLYLINGNLQPLFKEDDMQALWEFWRFGKSKKLRYDFYPKAEEITDPEKLPATLAEFLGQFQSALSTAGFNQYLINHLPTPTRQKRKGYNTPKPGVVPPIMEAMATTIVPDNSDKKRSAILDFFSRLFK